MLSFAASAFLPKIIKLDECFHSCFNDCDIATAASEYLNERFFSLSQHHLIWINNHNWTYTSYTLTRDVLTDVLAYYTDNHCVCLLWHNPNVIYLDCAVVRFSISIPIPIWMWIHNFAQEIKLISFEIILKLRLQLKWNFSYWNYNSNKSKTWKTSSKSSGALTTNNECVQCGTVQ